MTTKRTLTSRTAALLALYDLSGDRRAVDTEDVAMRAAEVAPKAFRWKKYPEQIDLERVRMALIHNKEHKPAFVSGGVRDGWQLTTEGFKACLALRRNTPAASEAETNRLRHSTAFATWTAGSEGAVKREEVLELLRVNDYFPESKRRQRAAAVINAAVGNPELESFVNALTKKYPEVMRT